MNDDKKVLACVDQSTYAQSVTDGATGCQSFTTLTIRVLPLPTPKTDPADLVACDDVDSPNGTELFDLTANEAYLADGDPNLSFEYYDADGNVPSQFEMYDLLTDPRELKNLAHRSYPRTDAQKRQFKRLYKKLQRIKSTRLQPLT